MSITVVPALSIGVMRPNRLADAMLGTRDAPPRRPRVPGSGSPHATSGVPATPLVAAVGSPRTTRALLTGLGSAHVKPSRHRELAQPVIAWPVSGSKKYRRAGSTAKVTRSPALKIGRA